MSEVTTLHLFSKYITILPGGDIDASKVVSKKCYSEWLRTRKRPPRNPPHAFRKAITGHCRGDKGLQPFPPNVESAVLSVLRCKKVWPCFEGTNTNIGQRGYQTLGHWERKRKRKGESLYQDQYNASQKLIAPFKRRNVMPTPLATEIDWLSAQIITNNMLLQNPFIQTALPQPIAMLSPLSSNMINLPLALNGWPMSQGATLPKIFEGVPGLSRSFASN